MLRDTLARTRPDRRPDLPYPRNPARRHRDWCRSSKPIPPTGCRPNCGRRFDDVARDIDSISDFDNHLTDKLQFLLDATLGFINIAQNDVMKVMTIASVVGIPPVLIAGVYGMNFKNIPEYDWPWGYAYAWAMIVLTTRDPAGIFRWRKWI